MADALAGFHFPDDLWSRVIYDLVLATQRAAIPVETMVAALVPIYFGRVGSFVIENRRLTTDEAEEQVERQAREFELLKPYLVDRWRDGVPSGPPASTGEGGDGAGTSVTRTRRAPGTRASGNGAPRGDARSGAGR
jgi:hypothetical protein